MFLNRIVQRKNIDSKKILKSEEKTCKTDTGYK